MGNLVFQAALGGQVAVSGPNTASSYTIAVPTVNGTFVTTGDTATVTSTMISGPLSVAVGGTGVTTSTGSGSNVLSTSPTLVTPVLGTPTSVTLTNATGLPLTTGVTGTLPVANGGTNLTSFTANGVVYASSTSALATGSALTFDGTSKVTITGASSNGELRLIRTSTYPGDFSWLAGGLSSTTNIQLNDNTNSQTAYGYIGGASGYHVWYQAGSEKMRLTSTGLGIGTSSPAYALDISGSGVTGARIASSGSDAVLRLTNSGSGGRDWYLSSVNTSGSLIFVDNTASAARMLLDSSGNLGLGVTPSAWNSGAMLGFQISTAASFAGDVGTPRARMMANAYYSSGGFKYITSNYATLYTQDGVTGQHQWLNAPSGTAGNAISFTQAMTLDNSGNLGIGTTSPTRKLDVSNAGSSYIRASDTTDSVYVDMLAASSGGWIGTQSNHAFLFQTNNTERMRLTSGGFLLVGTTSQPFGTGNFVSQSNSQTTAVPGVFSDTRSDASGSGMLYFVRNGSLVGQVSTTSTATSYVTSSDRRLKNNIVDAPDGNIDQIKIRSFDWLTDNTHNTYGVIAQELLEVAPYAVHVPTNPDEMMGVDYSKLVPMMIKEIQSLKAEVATLKGA